MKAVFGVPIWQWPEIHRINCYKILKWPQNKEIHVVCTKSWPKPHEKFLVYLKKNQETESLQILKNFYCQYLSVCVVIF